MQANSKIDDLLDGYVAHITWVHALIRRHLDLAKDHDDFERFKRDILAECDEKKIRRDVIDIVIRDLARTFEEIYKNANTDEFVSPHQDTPLGKLEPAINPAPAGKKNKKNKKEKKERRGGKGNKKRAAQRSPIPGGRSKGVRNLVPADFPGATHIAVQMAASMTSGCACPQCHAGKLERSRPAELLRFEARAPIEAVVYDVERVRCGACRQQFEAWLPEKIERSIALAKATPEAAAQSLVLRYGQGFPDTRLEDLQDWHGIPFGNSRQWSIASQAFDALKSIQKCFVTFVANATLHQVDDCTARVISEHLQIRFEIDLAQAAGFQERHVRTGLQATVFIASRNGITYQLFQIGRAHQGERAHQMAKLRTNPEPLVRVTDAASKANCLKTFPQRNSFGFVPQRNTAKDRLVETGVTSAFCLEHLRQTLEKAKPGFAREMEFLMTRLVRIFEIDAQAKVTELDNTARLAWHNLHSGPLMNEMLAYAHDQIATNPKAEPNSDYRRALGYFVGNQAGLTAFLREPGVPLTTTEAERGAKFTKRHHHNSLSFQTARGADVGAFFMSLIATCLGLGVNPLQYLATIIHWRARITDDNASDWMPDTFERGIEAARKAYQGNILGYRVCHRRIRDPMTHESPPQSALFSPAKSQASQAVH